MRALAVLAACASLSISSFARAAAGRVVVTILETTDLHGHLLPWDYGRAQPADEGLARVASRIEAIRRETPNVLLLDAGDTIQGTPIEYLHAKAVRTTTPIRWPTAMSAVKYDAMAVGNHEFNFGLDVLRKAQKEASFPWLSANTRKWPTARRHFPEYLVKTVGGVRIGVLGLTTPNIPTWEPEQQPPRPAMGGSGRSPRSGSSRSFAGSGEMRLRRRPHPQRARGGLENAGARRHGRSENRVAALARDVPGIDLLLTGHTHRRIPLTRLNGVPLIQPGRWGDALARVDVVFESAAARGASPTLKGALLLSGPRWRRTQPSRRSPRSTTNARAPTWRSGRVADDDVSGWPGAARGHRAHRPRERHPAQGDGSGPLDDVSPSLGTLRRVPTRHHRPARRLSPVSLREPARRRGDRRRDLEEDPRARSGVLRERDVAGRAARPEAEGGDDPLQLRRRAGRGLPDRPDCSLGLPRQGSDVSGASREERRPVHARGEFLPRAGLGRLRGAARARKSSRSSPTRFASS